MTTDAAASMREAPVREADLIHFATEVAEREQNAKRKA
jgi:hypothetical protein